MTEQKNNNPKDLSRGPRKGAQPKAKLFRTIVQVSGLIASIMIIDYFAQPQEVPFSTPEIVKIVGFSFLIFVVFVFFVNRRWTVVMAFIALSVGQWFGWPGLQIEHFAFLAGILLFAVLAEAWRQNKTVFQALPSAPGSLRTKAFYLWWPILAFLVIGILANFFGSVLFREFIFARTDIDHFCEVGIVKDDTPRQYSRCDNVGNWLSLWLRELLRGGEEKEIPAVPELALKKFVRDRSTYAQFLSWPVEPKSPNKNGGDAKIFIGAEGLTTLSNGRFLLGVYKSDDLTINTDALYRLANANVNDTLWGIELPSEPKLRLQTLRKRVEASQVNQFIQGPLSNEVPPLGDPNNWNYAARHEILLGTLLVLGEKFTPEAIIAGADQKTDSFEKARHYFMSLSRKRFHQLSSLDKVVDERRAAYNQVLKDGCGVTKEKNLAIFFAEDLATIPSNPYKEPSTAAGSLIGAVCARAIDHEKLKIDGELRNTDEQLAIYKPCQSVTPFTAPDAVQGTQQPSQDSPNPAEQPPPKYCTSHPQTISTVGAVHKVQLSTIDSVHLSIVEWHHQQRHDIEFRVMKAAFDIENGDAEAKKGAQRFVNFAPRSLDLGRDTCGLFNIVGCIKNKAKEYGERTYAAQREKAATDYTNSFNRAADETTTTAEENIIKARRLALRLIAETADDLHGAVIDYFFWESIITALLVLLLLIAIVKSYLYVLAQVVFNPQSGFQIDGLGQDQKIDADSPSEPSEGAPKVSQFTRCPSMAISLERGLKLATTVVHPNQKRSLKLVYQLSAGVFARIRYGKYFMWNVAAAQEGPTDILIQAEKGREIVSWLIQEGDSVAFRYKDLLGLTSNIRLKTVFSMSLSTLILGRFWLPMASASKGGGHGYLYLAVDGHDKINQSDVLSTDPRRLIAWSSSSKMQVDSPLTLRSIYFDGFNLIRVLRGASAANGAGADDPENKRASLTDGTILLEPSNGRTGIAGTIWEFAVRMLLPF